MFDGFFDDHELLGSVFDLDHDGNLDFSEAVLMSGVGAALLDEAERSTEEERRFSDPWGFDENDDDDDAYDFNA